MDKDQPVADVRTMDQWVARTLSQARFSSTLLTTFAGLALALAAIGIYGVMSYSVSQRTSEIGIRLALGAEARDILGMVVGNAVAARRRSASAIGVVLALALSRTLTSLLYETAGTDPLTFTAVVARARRGGDCGQLLPRAARVAHSAGRGAEGPMIERAACRISATRRAPSGARRDSCC